MIARNILRTGKKSRPKTAVKGKRYRIGITFVRPSAFESVIQECLTRSLSHRRVRIL